MHDFLSTFPIKTLEYLVAVSFLVSFPLFWKFVNGGLAAQRAVARKPVTQGVADFLVPEGLMFHPGHVWAHMNGAAATVGMDDFAHKLLGAISAVELPAVGARVGQGESALKVRVGDRIVEMLSPVDGKVVAVNAQLANSAEAIKVDPYGAGWLFKVEPARPEANAKHLFTAARARDWMNQVWEDLRAQLSPELGLVAQDGGAPVDGIAQSIDPENWVAIAKKHFLT